MEHKDEMQPAMNAENISEAQEAPKEYAAEVPEQEAAKEGAKKGQEILTKIKDAFRQRSGKNPPPFWAQP